MPLFHAKYFIRWVATSQDSSKDRLRQVIIEASSWNDAREMITTREEKENQYCRVEFTYLESLYNVVLWK